MEIIDWLIHRLYHRIRITTTTLVSQSLLSLLQATRFRATSSIVIFIIHCHCSLLTYQPILQQAPIHSHCCSTPSLRYFDARCSPNLTRVLLHFHQMIWSTQRSEFEAGCSSWAKESLLLGTEKIDFCRRICGSFPCRE